MTGGKGKKTIDKILEVRRQEENQAALDVAARSADVDRAKEGLAAARGEQKAKSEKLRRASSTIRRRLEGGMKGAELALAQAHLEALRSDLEGAGTRVSESRKALGRAQLALKGARERLKRRSADRRVAERYTGRLARRQREEREKREEEEH
jgi:flagellar biosynthesis chaperone FliJ